MIRRPQKTVFLMATLWACIGELIVCTPAASQEQACGLGYKLPIVAKNDKRDRAIGDYITLVYDADKHLTDWYDYKGDDTPKPIYRNASLFPIVYYKEKMAVHVCGLHFGDSLTVTMNPTGLPEGGADFRGAAPNTAPPLQSSADALSGSGATGGSTQAESVSFGSTQAIGSLTLNGLTIGSNGAKTNGSTPDAYTDASISIAPEQLIFAKRSYRKDAQGVQLSIRELETGSAYIDSDKALPGSVIYLQNEADHLASELEAIMSVNNNPDKYSPAAFDEYESRIQAFIGELNGLNGTLSSAGLGTRALMLQQNYASIASIENAVRNIIETDKPLCNSAPKQCPSDTNCTFYASTDKKGVQTCTLKKSMPACPKTVDPVHTADTINCHYWEQQVFQNFQDQYDQLSNAELGGTRDIKPQEIFKELSRLQTELRKLVKQTGNIFKIMNSWYEESRFEQTDLLTPATGNALERINIIVQRNFVPFTFAAGGGGPSPAGGQGSPSVAGGGGGASGGVQGTGGSTTTPAHTAETILVEVHRRANFNIVAGIMVIRVPTKSFSVQPEIAASTVSGSTTVYPASCSGGTSVNIPASAGAPSTPFYCATVTQTSNWQVAGMAGVAWFPLGRDYFPRGTSGSLHLHNMIPAVLVATSITSLGNSFIGPDFEPVNGLDLYIGVAAAHQTGLPNTQPLTTVLLPVGGNNSPPTLSTVTHIKPGLTFGIGFDLSVFTQIFGKTSSASLP